MNKKIIPLALMILFANTSIVNADDLKLAPPLSLPPQTQVAPTLIPQQVPVQQQVPSQQQVPAQQQAPDPALVQAVDASVQAAEAWLKIVDQGSYGNSWDAAALPLRLTMSRKEWMLSLDTMRKGLGHPVDRKVADIRLAQDPKGLARGNYMIVIFETTFTGGHLAKEIVTLQQSNNGQWNVMTYLVSVLK